MTSALSFLSFCVSFAFCLCVKLLVFWQCTAGNTSFLFRRVELEFPRTPCRKWRKICVNCDNLHTKVIFLRTNDTMHRNHRIRSLGCRHPAGHMLDKSTPRYRRNPNQENT